MQQKNMIKGYIFIILSGIIYGCMPLMAKHIYNDGVNPMTLVFFRNLFALPFMVLIAKLSGKSLKIDRKALPSLTLVALLGCCITPLLLFSSYKYIASGTATVFHFIYPAVVIAIEFIFCKIKVYASSIVSLAVCVIGIFMFYTPGQELSLTGSGIALLSGVTYALYIVLLASFRHREITGMVFSFYVSLICSVVLLVICLISGQLTLPGTPAGLMLCIFFAVAVNVGAMVLFQSGTFLVGGQRASILSTAEPITGVFVGALVLNEAVSLRTGFGAFLVILASILIAVSDMHRMKKQ